MKNRKFLIPAALLVILVGAYFLFFVNQKDGAPDSLPSEGQDSSSNGITSIMEKRKQTAALETAQPQDYVLIEIDPRKNLFGETVIEGKLTNKATMTSYKDFELMIHWNDAAGMVLDSAVEVVMEGLDPGENVEFKTKRKGPKRSRSTVMKLRAAKASPH